MLAADDEKQGYHHAEPLTDDGCNGCAAHAELGEEAYAVDEHRVEHDIRDRTDELRYHGEVILAHALQYPLAADLDKYAEAEDHADAEVARAELENLGIIRKELEKGFGKEPEHRKYKACHEQQKHAVCRSPIRLFMIAHAEAARDICVHAHARTHGECHHKHLYRVSKGDSIERLIADKLHI